MFFEDFKPGKLTLLFFSIIILALCFEMYMKGKKVIKVTCYYQSNHLKVTAISAFSALPKDTTSEFANFTLFIPF